MAVYYIDADNGNDANAGTLLLPWATLDKMTENARNPGDKAILRRGTAARYDDGTDLTFTSDGTIDNPIILEADYDNANWPVGGQDFVNSAQTYTPVFGCKALLASANSDFVVGEWMYESTEDNREFSYEVAGVQNADNGTDDGAVANQLNDAGKFGATVLGTYVQNTTAATEGYVSELIDVNTVEVTEDGRPSGDGGTIVTFANGDNWTIPAQIVLFLPYKGDISGAGKTLVRMPAAPIWNLVAGAFQWNFDADNYWKVQGLHLRGTDANGIVEIDSCGGHVFKDCIFEMNGANDFCIFNTGETFSGKVLKCRFYNYRTGIINMNSLSAPWITVKDCLFDGNSVALSSGIGVGMYANILFEETECRNHVSGDLDCAPIDITFAAAALFARGPLLLSATEVNLHQNVPFSHFNIEDHNSTVGDNRQLTGFSVAEGTPSIQSETTTVRVGGGTTSIKCTPSAELATAWEMSKVQLFEYPIYAAVGAHTYTIYYMGAGADFTVDPTAAELWIEAEYWHSAAFNHRRIFKSVGASVMDGTWNTLAVTVTCAQAGVLYLRGWYAKPKEAVPSNIFYTDTKVVIT